MHRIKIGFVRIKQAQMLSTQIAQLFQTDVAKHLTHRLFRNYLSRKDTSTDDLASMNIFRTVVFSRFYRCFYRCQLFLETGVGL